MHTKMWCTLYTEKYSSSLEKHKIHDHLPQSKDLEIFTLFLDRVLEEDIFCLTRVLQALWGRRQGRVMAIVC